MKTTVCLLLLVSLTACDSSSSDTKDSAGSTPASPGSSPGTPAATPPSDANDSTPTPTPPSAGTTATKTPAKRPTTGSSTPKPTGSEPAGVPEEDVIGSFTEECFDPAEALDALPDELSLSDGDDELCSATITGDDVEEECGGADEAIWVFDSDACVVGVYFPECGLGEESVSDFVLVFGALEDGTVWAQAEANDGNDDLLCAWDPEGTDVVEDDCEDLDEDGFCDDEVVDGGDEGDDSCEFALDDECDEPDFCDVGTDTTDCAL